MIAELKRLKTVEDLEELKKLLTLSLDFSHDGEIKSAVGVTNDARVIVERMIKSYNSIAYRLSTIS